jgi:hypothetical protein
MKSKARIIAVASMFVFVSIGSTQREHFPTLEGPYLGQKPPGKTPELYAPEIFKAEVHGGLVFSPDGKEVYWDLMEEGHNILYMRIKNSQWTEPAEVPFTSMFGTGNATFSPDGNKLFFTSQETIEGGRKGAGENIWHVERKNGGWGKPKPLSSHVNSYPLHWQLSVAANGNLYFGADGDIYMAIPQNGQYTTVQKAGASINTEHYDSTPFVAPDEDYMIFSRFGGDLRYADLFISFKDRQGHWTDSINMGPRINSDMHELCPNVTADRKYLFFNRNHGEKGELRVFWVSSKVIDDLKPEELKYDWPTLEGPYLGQKPPGKTPEIFAPGIVPTENNEGLYGFFNNGMLFLFDRTPVDLEEWTPAVYRMELKDGKWTKPNASPHLGKPWYNYYAEAAEGEQVYFAWRGSLGDATSSPDLNIWRVRKAAEGWTEPKKLPPPVNTLALETFPSLTEDGTLYFFSNQKGGFGGHDIYRAPSINGEFPKVENLGAPINTEDDELDPFIAPDESYLIYCSRTLEGLGGFDLYITFRNTDGTWTEPVNMGEGINTSAFDWVPYVTPDGKYFFFNSTRSGSWDIYWVDASIIQELKPKEWN